MIKKSDFYFKLPDESIAKYPLVQRDTSKLLVHKKGKSEHRTFTDIAELLDADTLLVMNNAKVIPARLYFKRSTGAMIEVLLLEPVLPASYEESFTCKEKCRWKCIVGNSKKWKDGELIGLHDNPELVKAKLIDREQRIVELIWSNGLSFTNLINQIGELPLPPYLNRDTENRDTETYQTVFAKNEGSVAAPTAGLHFTSSVLGALRTKGVRTTELTLHVGAGTFLPVKEDNVLDHEMHCEYFEVTKEGLGSLIDQPKRVAVGTTSLRVLESLFFIGCQLAAGNESLKVTKLEPYNVKTALTYVQSLQMIRQYLERNNLDKLQAATEIMILPSYVPRSIVGLITNFHLPESTLLMLIASVVGDTWKYIYKEALEENYRFLSYGDSSLLFVE